MLPQHVEVFWWIGLFAARWQNGLENFRGDYETSRDGARDPPIIVAVDDEPSPHCGAVKGGGKRLRSFVGSARTACNWSL